MITLGDAQALEEFDADFGRYDESENGYLKKLSAFSRSAPYLHELSSTRQVRG